MCRFFLVFTPRSSEAEIVRHGSEPCHGRGLCGAGVFNQMDGHARGRKGRPSTLQEITAVPFLTLLSFHLTSGGVYGRSDASSPTRR